MRRPDYGEMATVQRRNWVTPSRSPATTTDASTAPSGRSRYVDDEFSYSQPVRGDNRLGDEVATRQITEEAHLGFGSEAVPRR